jgi:predicted deacylase
MKTMSKVIDSLLPGTRWQGMVSSALDSSVSVPMLIAKGSMDGPTLLVTGGVHGDEYEGPAAIHQFMKKLDPSGVAGTVIGIPVVNLTAWRNRSRFSATDGVDLNRTFAQSIAPEHSKRLAEFVFDDFVKRCDVLIDLHSGGQRMDHLPLIGWYRNADGRAESLARRFHPDMHPWLVPDAAGVLSYEAHRIGKVAFGAEWHGGGTLDLSGARALAEGLGRTMNLLGMTTQGEEVQPDMRQAIEGDYITTDYSGLFMPNVALGQTVEVNQTIGMIYDELGIEVSSIRSNAKGIIAALPHLSYVIAGERIAYIG